MTPRTGILGITGNSDDNNISRFQQLLLHDGMISPHQQKQNCPRYL